MDRVQGSERATPLSGKPAGFLFPLRKPSIHAIDRKSISFASERLRGLFLKRYLPSSHVTAFAVLTMLCGRFTILHFSSLRRRLLFLCWLLLLLGHILFGALCLVPFYCGARVYLCILSMLVVAGRCVKDRLIFRLFLLDARFAVARFERVQLGKRSVVEIKIVIKEKLQLVCVIWFERISSVSLQPSQKSDAADQSGRARPLETRQVEQGPNGLSKPTWSSP